MRAQRDEEDFWKTKNAAQVPSAADMYGGYMRRNSLRNPCAVESYLTERQALMIDLTSLFSIGTKLIDKLIPDPEQKARAQLELGKMAQDGRLDEMKIQMSAILAEAQSADPWTSRARPSFLYVVYVLLLWSIPMGVLTVFYPDAAQSFTVGFKGWMDALPEPILTLFGTVMLGYVVGRSWEKVKGAAK